MVAKSAAGPRALLHAFSNRPRQSEGCRGELMGASTAPSNISGSRLAGSRAPMLAGEPARPFQTARSAMIARYSNPCAGRLFRLRPPAVQGRLRCQVWLIP
jgi:hypothetical protein